MRAVKKSVLRIKGSENSAFEEAYFIIKDVNETSYKTENVTRDMVFEANRIIEENFDFSRKKKNSSALLYFLTLILGGLLVQILNIIF
ncbi:MAG: hypothetical protein IKY62_04140 [Clostridia bacterium]|jgi:hypothetical protein|nr:hypothetical protein [Clostridia bacterium]